MNEINIKIKIENDNKEKIYILKLNIKDDKLKDSEYFFDNINNFFSDEINNFFTNEEEKRFYLLYNSKNEEYILNFDEILNFINQNSNYVLILKNCSNHVKNIIDLIINENYKKNINENQEDENFLVLLKKLKENYLLVPTFIEEFIGYEAIKYLIYLLLNKKYENFIIELLDNLFTYESSYLYLNFNRDLIKNLFELLMKNSDILYYNLILKIFYYLIEIIGEKEEHISSLLMSYAFEYKNNYNIHSNACDKLCNLINHIDVNIKINTLKLIIELIKSSENTENFKQKDKFFEEFYKSNIIKILEKNVTCNSKDFQKLIKEFSILSGNIIKGSEYELEITKKKLEDLKKEVEKIEKEKESNIIQEQYNDMIIKELIKFRNLSENNKKFFLPNNPKFHHTKENDNLLLNNENIDIKKEINNYIVSEKHQLITNINILREEEKKCNNAQKDLNAIKKSNNILIDEINKLTDKRKTDPEIIEKFKYYENKSYEANLEKQNYEKKIEEIQDTILTIQNYLASDNEKIKNNENIINEEINILNNLKNEEIEIKNEIKEVNEKINFLNKDEEINNLLDIKKNMKIK